MAFYHGPAVLRRRTYPRLLVRGLVLFAVCMTAFAALASREWHSAAAGRDAALADYIALEAQGMGQANPALARQLALVADRLSPTLQATSTLLDATAGAVPAAQAVGGTPVPAAAPAPASALAAARRALASTRAFTQVTATTLSQSAQLFVAAGTNEVVYLWNLTATQGPTLEATLTGPRSPIIRVALNRDRGRLAVATSAGHIWLFATSDAVRASLIATLTVATRGLRTLAFSPNNQVLTVSRGHHLSGWFFRPYQAATEVCALAVTPLSAEQWAQYVPELPYRPPCPATG